MEQILNELGWQQLLPAFKSNNIDLSTFQPLLATEGDFSGHEGTVQFFQRKCGISSAHLQLICEKIKARQTRNKSFDQPSKPQAFAPFAPSYSH